MRAQAVFDAAVGGGTIVRAAPPASYRKAAAIADPSFRGEVQLIKGSKLTPLIAAPDGILLGEWRQGDRRIWVLADPDPIENHAIAKGGNAAFARDMIAALQAGRGGALVFDETIHGFRRPPPNLLKFLFEFPLNLVLVQMMAAVALLLWSAMGRFGAPQALPRPLESGRYALIANAGSLLDHAGHHAAILRRYVAMMLHDAGQALRAPPGLAGAALTAWISRAADARGIDTKPLEGLEPGGAGSRNLTSLLATAQALYRWRKDLPNGTSRRLDHH
nr:hypothetical protein [Enterovirga rhinocerotis]